jgi:hypothetical protein
LRTQPIIVKHKAANSPETGMVRNQAVNNFLDIPHLTADSRLVAPAPTIEPVMVWVVLTGTARNSIRYKVIAPDVSAITPS